jgi:cytochrome c biogenesis factor
MNKLKNIGILTVIVGALVTLGLLASTTSAFGSLKDLIVTVGFYVWVLLPFVILLVLNLYAHRKALSSASRVAILLTSVLVVVSSVLVYWTSIFNSDSSTSALVFVFIPLLSLVAIGVGYGLARLLLGLLMTRSKV